MNHENCGSTADELFAAAGLSSSELARLSEVLTEFERTQAESPYVIAAIRLLILTGCRVGEILNLRWQDVDFEGECLHLPESKTEPKTCCGREIRSPPRRSGPRSRWRSVRSPLSMAVGPMA